MTSLLTLFFMVYAEAGWWWYALWCMFALGSLVRTVRSL